jgi:Domain of unknown function (DUF4349)
MISEQTIRDALAAEAEAIEVPRRAAAALAALAAEPNIVHADSKPSVSRVRRPSLIVAGTLAAGIALGAGFVGPLRRWLQSEPGQNKADVASIATDVEPDESITSETSALSPDENELAGGSADVSSAARARALSATFNVTVDADELGDATERVVSIAHGANGTVAFAQDSDSSDQGADFASASSFATVRLSIPVADFSAFANQLDDIGTITAIDERDVDVQPEYEALTARKQLLDQTVLAYQTDIAGANGTDTVQSALQQLAHALQQLAAVERRLRELRETTQYVTVTVTLQTNGR